MRMRAFPFFGSLQERKKNGLMENRTEKFPEYREEDKSSIDGRRVKVGIKDNCTV